jgi:hypothetical protein
MTSLAADGTEIAGPAILNLFPAQLIGPDGHATTGVRVVLLPDEIIVYGEAEDARGRYAHTAARIPVVLTTPVGDRWTARDANGGEYAILVDRGCGCGSPLKNFPQVPPADLVRWPA